jgi:hypothetical protein
LLEAVESFIEAIDSIFAIANFEARRLLDVDCMINCRIEKRRFEVELVNKEMKNKCDRD